MTIRNKYLKHSRISEAKSREIVRHFSLDLASENNAILTNLNRNTVNLYLLILRKRIAEYYEQHSLFKGEIDVDESYFCAKRIRGIRGRGAGATTPERMRISILLGRIAQRHRTIVHYILI